MYSRNLCSIADLLEYLVDEVDPSNGKVTKCTLCGKFSRHKGTMRRHVTLVHTKPTNDVCKYCKKVFKRTYYLDKHIRARECEFLQYSSNQKTMT